MPRLERTGSPRWVSTLTGRMELVTILWRRSPIRRMLVGKRFARWAGDIIEARGNAPPPVQPEECSIQ